MFTASSLLLLLTLILNIQLCSSASISVKVIQFSVVAEEPGPAEDKEPVQEKVALGDAGEVGSSPEILPAKEDIVNVAEDPVLTEELIFADVDQPVSQELAHHKVLGAAADEPLEKKIVPVDVSFAEASPNDNEVSPAATVDSEFADQHLVKDLTPKAPITVIPLETLENKAQEDPGDKKAAPENQEETIHIVSSDTKAPHHAKEEEDKADDPILLEEDTEEDPLYNAELEEDFVHLFLAQFEDQVEPSAESGPEDLSVIVPIESSEGEFEQEDDAVEESISLDDLLEEEKLETPEEYTGAAVTVVPMDLEMDDEGQEETATQQSVPEEPVVEEPVSEDLKLVAIPMEDQSEEISEGGTEEVQSDPLPEEPALEEAVARDYEPYGGDPDIFIISITETTSEVETITLAPVEKSPAPATETLTEVTSPAPAVTEETSPSSLEGVTVSSNTTYTDEFKAVVVLTEDESGVNKGALIGAVFFILVSLIVIGAVGAIVSKKLRQ